MGRHRVPETPVFEADFEAFYAATSGRTFAAIHRVAGGDVYLARDAVQEAYLAMWKTWHERRGRELEDNRKYVRKIAVHKILDGYRARRWQQVELDDDDVAVLVEDGAFDAVLDELSVWRSVRELLARQPPRRRAVGVLFFLEDLNDQEIADVLGISPSTVRTHIERLRAVFRPHRDRIVELSRGGERW
ncbi:sigma-70 family RNA polymerase sigma factor [Amycolatopsis sp. NPDC051071]|uniref:RNA polymerase sigma factor n=1 Tax=Amycolatopsis sp. NPDC051071 TaxID=3154637 RepID=UPI00342DE54B